jgi:adenylate kinase family enzyme
MNVNKYIHQQWVCLYVSSIGYFQLIFFVNASNHALLTFYVQLDEMLQKQGAKIDKVLNFAIDDAILEERITGRWIHPSSGRTYHTKFAPPKVPGVDDVRKHE